MEPVELQLILGRARLSARRLRTAAERLRLPAEIAAVEALLGRPPEALRRLGLSPAACAWLSAPDQRLIERDRRWQERHGVTLLDTFDVAYPSRLAAISDAPALLYARGAAAALSAPQLAIVGTRMPTVPAHRTSMHWAGSLASAGLTITSGLALGIDAAAHHGALLAGGRTVAVLGSGLDQIYPERHERLAERIVASGALLSELPPQTAPVRWSFPRRNRLISGLSLGTLVIEAACDSGSLSTARRARSQGRLLFAMPGSIHNHQVRGCHQLIREGALLVQSATDILRAIRPFLLESEDISMVSKRDRVTPKRLRLDKDQKILLDALGFEPASIDTLVGRTGFPSHSVSSLLVTLQFAGAVGREPGGRFVRLFDERHG
jgi:DNA processing protein